jgi:hypothetical protein
MSRSTAMLRVLGLLPCALIVAVAAMAAPAPVYKPRLNTAWVTGWDKPVDPLGDCRFDKEGDKLTISVPGKGHTFGREVAGISAPHLLREVEGDFSVEVRVVGDFRDANFNPGETRRGGGLLLADGVNLVRFGRFVDDGNSIELQVAGPDGGRCMGGAAAFPEPIHLRIERRKDVLTMKFSRDRREWSTPFAPYLVALPKKLKVGVFAESMAPGSFAPVFDQFVLTP